jgi:hypothetical protein
VTLAPETNAAAFNASFRAATQAFLTDGAERLQAASQGQAHFPVRVAMTHVHFEQIGAGAEFGQQPANHDVIAAWEDAALPALRQAFPELTVTFSRPNSEQDRPYAEFFPRQRLSP